MPVSFEVHSTQKYNAVVRPEGEVCLRDPCRCKPPITLFALFPFLEYIPPSFGLLIQGLREVEFMTDMSRLLAAIGDGRLLLAVT